MLAFLHFLSFFSVFLHFKKFTQNLQSTSYCIIRYCFPFFTLNRLSNRLKRFSISILYSLSSAFCFIATIVMIMIPITIIIPITMITFRFFNCIPSQSLCFFVLKFHLTIFNSFYNCITG